MPTQKLTVMSEFPRPRLQAYDAFRGVQILGDLWTARKGDHTLRVELRTHPLGWELRGLVASEMHRTQVCKTEPDVHQTAETWRADAVAKGWAVTAPAHRLGDSMDTDRQGG